MYRSILVPLDGSDYAEQVLAHVERLASADCRITLLTVMHTVDELIGTRQPSSDVDLTEDILASEAYNEERASANLHLKHASDSLALKGRHAQVRLVEGAPTQQILQAAQDEDADLIVMTTYGRSASSTPTKDGVFGGVVDGVLRAARIPVLVIRPVSNS